MASTKTEAPAPAERPQAARAPEGDKAPPPWWQAKREAIEVRRMLQRSLQQVERAD
ncbi:hypothetical protein [Frigidibacter sp. MR17.24]|uniref:hypothetical protein n=1 Tax=Frigidibacter sp. MR17.24 TaxID=3127345 RepID=UPI0030131D9E